MWNAAQRAQPARPLELVADCSLVNHKLRDSQFVRGPIPPPVARQRLMRRQHRVATWSCGQIADDRRFNVHRCHGLMIARLRMFQFGSDHSSAQRVATRRNGPRSQPK